MVKLNKYIKAFCLFGFCYISVVAKAQVLPDSIQQCENVRKWIKQNFYDNKRRKVQSYAKARKYMYAYIDNYNDTLTCVYGGLKVYHKYGEESTNVDPLNCEHTIAIPREYITDADFYDIHHLYPVNKKWNSTRKDYPFKDISDNLTKKWMINDTFIKQIPQLLIDSYSEYYNFTFEPREAHKGNVARSIYYYFTVNGIMGFLYVSDLETLKRWHEQDPPDDRERERNNRIEKYQGNRNPYIDHPEWVYRAWYCKSNVTPTSEIEEKDIKIYPNPISEELHIDFNQKESYNVSIYNIIGELVFEKKDVTDNTPLALSYLNKGTYFLQIKTIGSSSTIRRKMFIKL